MEQQQTKRAALFGHSGRGGLDAGFAKSIGDMNQTIEDAEEVVHAQEQIFSDMDSLLMMQKVSRSWMVLSLTIQHLMRALPALVKTNLFFSVCVHFSAFSLLSECVYRIK